MRKGPIRTAVLTCKDCIFVHKEKSSYPQVQPPRLVCKHPDTDNLVLPKALLPTPLECPYIDN